MITNQTQRDDLNRLLKIHNYTTSAKAQPTKAPKTQYGAKGANQSETASAFGTGSNRYGLSQTTQPKPKRFQSRYINNDGKWTYDAVNDGYVGFNDYISDIKDDYKGVSFNDKIVQVGQFGNDLKPKPKPIKTKNLDNYKLNGRITQDTASVDSGNFSSTISDTIRKHRSFWWEGAEVYLNNTKGYFTSAWMLKHSLQDKPSDITRDNTSRIAQLINDDPAYLRALDDKIAHARAGYIDDVISVSFENTKDLYYSIHKADIHIKGRRDYYGKWSISATLSDTYDFTEITTHMGDKWYEFSKAAGLGTIANDAAYFSQQMGAINPYKVTVYFYTIR